MLLLIVLVAASMGSSAPAQEAGTVTVYSSLPLRGVDGDMAKSVRRGIRLALEDARGQAGLYDVRYESLNDATRRAHFWDPGRESANARRAAIDESSVAYIGAFNSGASAVSLPILNEAGILQVSPSNTLNGLTRDEPGAEPGAPEKYYPTGDRNYVRVIARNTVQADGLALLMQDAGCNRVYFIHDGRNYGRGFAKATRRFARERGLAAVGFIRMDPSAPNYRSLARAIRDREPDCVVFGGLAVNNAAQLFRDVSATLPDASLFGGEGLADRGFTDRQRGGLPAGVARKTFLVQPTLAHDAYPPSAQDFFTRYRERFGKRAGVYGIYGYEAMGLTLDAIARAGAEGDERDAVIEAAFATRDRESVLGTYSIDSFGDTTLAEIGAYRVADGRLLFDRVLRP